MDDELFTRCDIHVDATVSRNGSHTADEGVFELFDLSQLGSRLVSLGGGGH